MTGAVEVVSLNMVIKNTGAKCEAFSDGSQPAARTPADGYSHSKSEGLEHWSVYFSGLERFKARQWTGGSETGC